MSNAEEFIRVQMELNDLVINDSFFPQVNEDDVKSLFSIVLTPFMVGQIIEAAAIAEAEFDEGGFDNEDFDYES